MDPVSTDFSEWLSPILQGGMGGVVLWLVGVIVQQRRLRQRDRDDFELMARIVDADRPDAPLMLERMANIFKARRERRPRRWPR